jgi:hypothetical protein
MSHQLDCPDAPSGQASRTRLDAENGGRTLFDLTFGGSLSLLPTWEDQPETFREQFRRKAVAVAIACEVDAAYVEPTTARRTA